MRKLSKYKINKVKKNIDFFFNHANDKEIKQGKEWYLKANEFIKTVSNNHNVSQYKVAQVVSALSPRNKWDQNLKDSIKVIKAYNKGLKPEDVKVCTFHSNKFRAFRILADKIEITNSSLKTHNFVNNIAFLDPNSVTIDIWHIRACFKDKININNASIGKLAYNQIKQITINKANNLGLKPYELQAIIWLSAQRYFNN